MFSFPSTVDERSARLVATGVVTLTIAFLVSREAVILAALALGFWARVGWGPRFSPLARLVTQVLTPAIGAGRQVAGPPKRFAQAIGATLSTAAGLAWLAGSPGLALLLVAMITGAATLEAAFGLCLGCHAYQGLIRLGVIAEDACVECADITRRQAA